MKYVSFSDNPHQSQRTHQPKNNKSSTSESSAKNKENPISESSAKNDGYPTARLSTKKDEPPASPSSAKTDETQTSVSSTEYDYDDSLASNDKSLVFASNVRNDKSLASPSSAKSNKSISSVSSVKNDDTPVSVSNAKCDDSLDSASYVYDDDDSMDISYASSESILHDIPNISFESKETSFDDGDDNSLHLGRLSSVMPFIDTPLPDAYSFDTIDADASTVVLGTTCPSREDIETTVGRSHPDVHTSDLPSDSYSTTTGIMSPPNLLFIEGKHDDAQSVGTSITSVPDDAIVIGAGSCPDAHNSDIHSDSRSANNGVSTPNLLLEGGKNNDAQSVSPSVTSIPDDEIVTGAGKNLDECTIDLHSVSHSANIDVRNTPNLLPIVDDTSIPYDAHRKDPSIQIVTDSLKVQPGVDMGLDEKKLPFRCMPSWLAHSSLDIKFIIMSSLVLLAVSIILIALVVSGVVNDNPRNNVSANNSTTITSNQVRLPPLIPSSTISLSPSASPTAIQIVSPSSNPSLASSNTPPIAPSKTSSRAPSKTPSYTPSKTPSRAPSKTPSYTPSKIPSSATSKTPSYQPSSIPSGSTTANP